MKTLLFLFVLCANLWAGYYGQNKVQNSKTDWKILQTQHFDIYFGNDLDSIAQFTAKQIETLYDSVSFRMDHKLLVRIPIFLHNSPNHFRETNVIDEILPEGVGGFTEIFRNRIVVPFDGSRNNLHHVLMHEMVHAMMFDLFSAGGPGGIALLYKLKEVPLWFSEGLAEFISLGGQNLESELYLTDAVTWGYLPSPEVGMQGFLAYRGGQAFLYYLEEIGGKGTIQRILKTLAKGVSLNLTLQKELNASLAELGELWIRDMRKLYWPELGHRQNARNLALPLTQRKKDASFFNNSPRISPDAKSMVWASDKGNWEGIRRMNLQNRKDEGRLVKNAFSSDFESLHLFTSGFSWSPDGSQIALVGQESGQDVLQIIDSKSGKLLKTYQTGLDRIRNPDWAPNGDYIAFSGLTKGQQDLWLIHTQSQELQQLTQTTSQESKPKFNSKGNLLLYESNQGFKRWESQLPLRDLKFIGLLDLSQIEKPISQKLYSEKYLVEEPNWIPGDSSIAFISHESGLPNLKTLNLNTYQTQPLTNLLSGISSFDWRADSAGNQKLVYSLFEAGGWELYLWENPLQNLQLNSDSIQPSVLIKQLSSGQSGFTHPKRENLLDWREVQEDSIENIESDSNFYAVKDSINKNKDSLESARIDTIRSNANNEIFLSDSNLQIDSLGNFLKQDYKPLWSLERMWAAAGAGASGGGEVYYGGQIYLQFADVAGDQRSTIMLFGQGSSLEELSGMVNYEYLPYKTDYGIFASWSPYLAQEKIIVSPEEGVIQGEKYYDQLDFESTQFLIKSPDSNYLEEGTRCVWSEGDFRDTTDVLSSNCSRNETYFDKLFRTGLTLKYPLSRFSRLEGMTGFEYRSRTKKNWNSSKRKYIESPSGYIPHRNALLGSILWTFDNSRWGWTGPLDGSRLGLSLELNHSLDEDESWVNIQNDFRKYLHFGNGFGLAMRTSNGASFELQGALSESYLLGGDDFINFNPAVKSGQRDATFSGIYSSTLATPFRGSAYHEWKGNRYSLTNLEFRFPFVRQMVLGFPPIMLHNINGVIFTDYGTAWSRGLMWEQAGHTYGYGLRVNLGAFIFRWSYAWQGHFSNLRLIPRQHYSIGADF